MSCLPVAEVDATKPRPRRAGCFALSEAFSQVWCASLLRFSTVTPTGEPSSLCQSPLHRICRLKWTDIHPTQP